MLPIRDNIPSRRIPIVTVGIIALNVLGFLWELQLGPRRLERAFIELAIVPVRYSIPEIAQSFSPAEQILPFFSSMFLHGGWLHLIGNMWTLWIFGDNVEDRLGRGKYLAFYLASGVVAALMHIYTNLGSQMPTIGASGAIAGVMGAYFVLYPRSRVLTLVPLIVWWEIFELPAIVLLGFWFLMQFLSAGAIAVTANSHGGGGVAFAAHVAGFIVGVIGVFVFRKPAVDRWDPIDYY